MSRSNPKYRWERCTPLPLVSALPHVFSTTRFFSSGDIPSILTAPTVRTASLLFSVALVIMGSLPSSAQPLLSLYSVRSPNIQPNGFFGRTVEAIGDADGDGVTDFLVGAFNEGIPTSPYNNTGRAYYYSGADGALIRTFTSPNAQAGGYFAVSVAAAGDANGDGTPDFLAASYHPVGAFSFAGRAYLISGADGATLLTLDSPNPQQEGLFGFNVAAPGDLNGDGTGDYVVGAPQEDVLIGGNVVVDHGVAYAFSGVDGALLWSTTPQTQESFVFGRVASVGGDLNGDGVPDLIASAVDAISSAGVQTGLAYAVDGSDGSILYQMESANAQNNQGGGFGWSLAGISDLNGDGVRDIGVGAPFEGVGGTHVQDGSVSFFNGATGARFGTYFEENRQAYRLLGWQVQEVGDLNGDGVTEIGVSAPNQFNAFQDRGSPFSDPFSGGLFITSGADIGMTSAEDVAEIYPTLPNFPTQFRWRFGEDFAPLGDVDGDGLPDIVVGVPYQGNNIGFVAVFTGASILAVSDVNVEAEGEQLINGDGTYGFASTAVSLVLNSVATLLPNGDGKDQSGGQTTVRVQRHTTGPNGTEGIAEASVALYRWVITSDGPLRFGAESAIRFELSEVPNSNVTDPNGIVVYHRASIGGGPFDALATSYDAGTGEIVATGFTAIGEFVFASDTNPLPLEPTAEAAGVTLRAAPNPASGAATVAVSLLAAEAVTVAVYDVLGREVAQLHAGPLAAGTHPLALETRDLPTGLYIVRASTLEAIATQRITVVR